MLSIKLTEEDSILNKALADPKIYQMVNGTPYTKPFDKTYLEELREKGFKFLVIYHAEEVIGVFSFREVTKLLIEAHIHILAEYHTKGFGKQAVEAGILWFKENTSLKQLVTYVPSNCFHVLKFMQSNNFIACGSIKDGVVYNNTLVSLFIFQRGV